MLPEVSVIVTSYNYGFWLERCLRSLINQKFIDSNSYEIIFIDDASSDNSVEVAKFYADKFPNIQLILNATNKGLPYCCNQAIKKSVGRFVVRVDADDYVARDFVFLGSWFLIKNRDYQAVSCDYVEVDQNEHFIRRVNSLEEEIACGVFFKRECLFDIGLYDVNFKMREGHELRQRFEKKYKMGRLEFPVYKYRKHNNNRTKNEDELSVYDEKLSEK